MRLIPSLPFVPAVLGGLLCLVSACQAPPPAAAIELPAPRVSFEAGHEIIACGQRFPVDAPVVLWSDPGGYDAYSTEYAFGEPRPGPEVPGPGELRYEGGRRTKGAAPRQLVPAGCTDPGVLAEAVDQFVLHYDVCGTSRRCFKVLHDQRGLSVHFMLDVDGTIYQTLDLRERAWHAGTANSRAIGIEIAHMGAREPRDIKGLEAVEGWYQDEGDRTRLALPAWLEPSGVRTLDYEGVLARPGLVEGELQGARYLMYDFTREQYESLVALTAALCELLPNLEPDAPREADGAVVDHALTGEELAAYQGILGHFHVKGSKIDPGPAFQWEWYLQSVRDRLESAD